MSEDAREQAKQSEEENKKKKRKKPNAQAVMSSGIGAWVLTFADLMSLLMAFFVMLFALSEVDKEKFKQLGISMREAFGSPISMTVDPTTDEPIPRPDTGKNKQTDVVKQQIKVIKEVKVKVPVAQSAASTTEDVKKIKEMLGEQIKEKEVEVKQRGKVIIISLLDSGAFPSGQAELTEEFKPVIAKLGKTLKKMKGKIIVSGYTDNIPIKNDKYRSNWELSSSRAYSVIQEFMTNSGMNPEELEIRGYGDTRKIAPNDTAENRAKNRRVEIMIDQRPQIKPKTEEKYEIKGPNAPKIDIKPGEGKDDDLPAPLTPNVVPIAPVDSTPITPVGPTTGGTQAPSVGGGSDAIEPIAVSDTGGDEGDDTGGPVIDIATE